MRLFRTCFPLVVAVLLLVFGASRAYASLPPQVVPVWGDPPCASTNPGTAIVCGQPDFYTDGCTISSNGTEAVCQGYYTGGRCGSRCPDGPYNFVTNRRGLQQQCPSNSSLNSQGSCDCSSGYVQNGSTCVSAQVACNGFAAGMSGTYYASAGGGGLNLCVGGCVIRGGVSGSDSSGTYFGGPYTATGGTCDGSAGSGGSPAAPSPTPLLPGNCPGTVNGVAVPGGVPCGSTTSGSSSSTTPGPTSSSSAPDGASNGTSSSSSTTCSGGSCTTTTTTTTTVGVGSAGGGTTTTGSSSTTQPQSSFCQSNPNDPQCGSSAFDGSCSGGFSCKGDAVACATAKIEYESTCLFNASPSSSTAAKYSALSSQAGQPAAGAFNDAQSIGNALPSAPAAGAGLADMSVSFGSGASAMTVSLPLGMYINPHLAVIRGVVTAFGYVMFVLIVFVRK